MASVSYRRWSTARVYDKWTLPQMEQVRSVIVNIISHPSHSHVSNKSLQFAGFKVLYGIDVFSCVPFLYYFSVRFPSFGR